MKHLKQIEALKDESRFKFLLCGRRGGKSFMIVEDILKTIHSAPAWAEVVYIAPTLQQAREIIWEQLWRRMKELGWQFRPYVSKSRFELSRRRKIYILGAEKISRIRGHKFYKAYMDEIAFFSPPIPEVWRTLRPALSDYKAGAIVATTPNGKQGSCYDFFLDIMSKPEWKCFHWTSADNPFLDPEEIEAAKRELDERSFEQEMNAGWVSFEGLAYYCFDENRHIKQQPPITPELPLHLCFDFNVNPTTLLLSQYERDRLRYKKEYSFKNSSTEETVTAFCQDYSHAAKAFDIRIRGDATGRGRSSNTGKADYDYAQQILSRHGFKWKFEVRASNPPIVDRLTVANSWLKPFVGEHKVEIDPSCKDLIRDLSSQVLNGRIPSDNNNLGHKADAFGYDIYWEHLVGNRKPQRTLIL